MTAPVNGSRRDRLMWLTIAVLFVLVVALQYQVTRLTDTANEARDAAEKTSADLTAALNAQAESPVDTDAVVAAFTTIAVIETKVDAVTFAVCLALPAACDAAGLNPPAPGG